ncbi:MAG: FeoB small GTPase domain-containing protein [Nitratireductor sp.]
MLGRLEGDQRPDILVCVADAANLRIMLRLVWASQCGHSHASGAQHDGYCRYRGIAIDVGGLSTELGIPVISTVAVSPDGTQALLQQIDAMANAGLASTGALACA